MNMIGFLDGVEVRFDFTPPNTFKAVVPKKMNGKYIVQLHCTDDAGNITNLSEISVLIDFDKLTFKALELDLNHNIEKENYSFKEFNSGFDYKELI